MEIHENTLEVYLRIVADGTLSALLSKALKAYYIVGEPCTAEEAHEVYCVELNGERNQNQFNSYTTTLKKECGALIPVRKGKNSKGNTVDIYKVTGTAHKPIKGPSKPERLQEVKELLLTMGRANRHLVPDLEKIWEKVQNL